MRPTWAEIDLVALAHNVIRVKSLLPSHCKLMAVIKADAYGHGALQVAYGAIAAGADTFGVATVEEAILLRHGGIRAPILVLGYVAPEAAWQVARDEITACVFSLELANRLQEAAAASGKIIPIHLKVDTGMSRIGVEDNAGGVAFALKLMKYPNLQLQGLFSHFATAEEEDAAPALRQLQRFEAFAAALLAAGVEIPILHIANTAAIFRFPQSHYDMVRLGVGMYGAYPSDFVPHPFPLEPVMTLKSHIIMLKKISAGTRVSYNGIWQAKEDSLIGTLPIGYADGLARSFSNCGYVSVRGVLAPIIGRVCMDQCVIDVTQAAGVHMGDEAIVFGQSDPDRNAFLVAEEVGAIPHELMACVSKRVPRFYREYLADQQ